MEPKDPPRSAAIGGSAAFSKLYRDWQPHLVTYAAGLLGGDRAAAEDVVEEAFVAIWRQAHVYSDIGNLMGWTRRIVRNKAVSWIRKRREIPATSEALAHALDQSPDDTPSPLQVAERKLSAESLQAALRVLNVDQREAIRLCYFEEKAVAEIADLMACPENTVKTRLFHARRILRESGLLNAA